MKKQTQSEKLINKAIKSAKEELAGNTLSNCNIEMNMQADGATQSLADALKEQAIANSMNSKAMLKLAEALKPIDVCAIKITNSGVEI